MLIGGMNHPGRDLFEEIQWMADMGLDFIDLTLEPPAANPEHLDPNAVRQAVDRHGLKVVGHTAYYLPIASAYESIREAAVAEGRRCLELAAHAGAQWINIHPDANVPFHDRPFIVRRNLDSLRDLAEHAQKVGIGLMVENMPGSFNTVEEMGQLLEPIPDMGMLLDLGHTNLRVPHNTGPAIIEAFPQRIKHVHLHDNQGGEPDLHLPLGTGNVPYKEALAALKRTGYDGTITLEVFSPDKRHFAFSRDEVRAAWDAA